MDIQDLLLNYNQERIRRVAKVAEIRAVYSFVDKLSYDEETLHLIGTEYDASVADLRDYEEQAIGVFKDALTWNCNLIDGKSRIDIYGESKAIVYESESLSRIAYMDGNKLVVCNPSEAHRYYLASRQVVRNYCPF